MKKILLILTMLIFTLPIKAYEIDLTKSGKTEGIVAKIGYTLLNANKIPIRATFYVDNKKSPNAYVTVKSNAIILNDSLAKYIDDEDQLAAIIAHELGHAVALRQGVFKGYFSIFSNLSKESEYKADAMGVDYMVKAGYNPVAMIVLLNRISDEYRYDWNLTHPLGSRRMMKVYEQIYTKYPEYLVDNKYKNNLIYQNFLLTSRKNRAMLEEKIKTGSRKKLRY